MKRTILTIDEVSARTRIPKATLRYYRSIGEGPRTWKLGRRVVAYEDDVEAWIELQYSAGVGA